ncbi:hypothetical protein BDZ97DRAFT_1760456 [Flammula alnicola]|nr:hypothetical protein BDZ97DRAFT_1760456 [Flammula alnicola]
MSLRPSANLKCKAQPDAMEYSKVQESQNNTTRRCFDNPQVFLRLLGLPDLRLAIVKSQDQIRPGHKRFPPHSIDNPSTSVHCSNISSTSLSVHIRATSQIVYWQELLRIREFDLEDGAETFIVSKKFRAPLHYHMELVGRKRRVNYDTLRADTITDCQLIQKGVVKSDSAYAMMSFNFLQGATWNTWTGQRRLRTYDPDLTRAASS